LNYNSAARRAGRIGLFLGFVLGLFALAAPASAQTTDFENAVAAFERKDVKFPPPQGAIVITGSSTIRLWAQVRNDLAPLEVIPRGFGSSTADDLDFYLDRLVLPYVPRAVVIYEGDHDLQIGMSPEFILERMTSVVQRIGTAYPQARIYLISVKPSPKYAALWPKSQIVNQMYVELCQNIPNCTYVDTASYLLLPNGKPNAAYFRGDRVHLNDAGYAVWNGVLKPALLAGERASIVLPELRDSDVGSVSGAGFSTLNDGTMTVYGSGSGVGGTSDGMHFAWRQLTGNGQVTARVAGQPDVSGSPVAGVMLRESLAANAKSAFAYLSPTTGARSLFRTSIGGQSVAGNGPLPSATTPHWLKLDRKAAMVYCWRSTDGVIWKDCGKAKLTGLKKTVYVGLAVSSQDNGAIALAEFDNVHVHGTSTLPSQP
jgi:lysophospholipase L1-like esterase